MTDIDLLVRHAKDSCMILLAIEPQGAVGPMVKWPDVVDDLLSGNEDTLKRDLEILMIEPLKILADSCSARLIRVGGLEAHKSLQRMLEDAGKCVDPITRKAGYVAYVNSVFQKLKELTGTDYPLLKELKP